VLTASLIGAVIVAVLGWNLLRRFASDRIQRLMDGRRSSSRLVSRGEYIDEGRHVRVSLALNGAAFYYESAESKDSLDLEWVEEVEYGNDDVTGPIIGEARLMRLRCFDQPFEFLIPIDALHYWQAMLPAHRKTAAKNALPIALPAIAKRKLSPVW
jgi:hypothetical protein